MNTQTYASICAKPAGATRVGAQSAPSVGGCTPRAAWLQRCQALVVGELARSANRRSSVGERPCRSGPPYVYTLWCSTEDSSTFIAVYSTFEGAQKEMVRLGMKYSSQDTLQNGRPPGLFDSGHAYASGLYYTYRIRKVALRKNGEMSDTREQRGAGYFV